MTSAPPSPDQVIDQILTHARLVKRGVLIIFSGTDCPWCEKLKGFLADGLLEQFCEANSIDLKWVTLQSREDEASHACEGGTCKIPPRSRYRIASIPTAMFFNQEGARVCSTEYLDEVEKIGGEAYTQWMRDHIPVAVTARITLEEAKANEARRDQILRAGRVRIWSGEWRAWWRPNSSGYTDDPNQAGVYPGSLAWVNGKHCGPEKKLAYDLLPE